MSSILYYSNFCEHSKKLLQFISKTQLGKDIHFMCIDKRVSEGGKTYIVLETGQKIVLPENVEENCCYSYEWDFLAKVPKVETWLLRHTLNQIKQTKHEQNR